MSRLTRTSLMLAFFFALDKVVAILRQVIIARQFGLSAELDSFNVANNIPDLLFALISGGALAIAFIPVLSEVLAKQGRPASWVLFSRIANLAFLTTAILAVIVAVLADPLVKWEIGVAPGFGFEQQNLVVALMRLNLVATLIFSISGLVMAGLQANQHFLLPAMAPLLYNLGQIFGAVILSPQNGYKIGSLVLPAFGMGVHGLVVGVILGAILHLGIQMPGLIMYQFRWSAGLGMQHRDVQKVLGLLGPRLITMFFIQLIFIIRDNLASRLQEGSVTALTYGWMIQQLPETLIGTAIGTALLPTLAEFFALGDHDAFQKTINRAVNVIIALTLPVAIILSLGLRPLMVLAFDFDVQGTDLLLWVTRGYLVGLTGHCLMEVAARSYYAQQDALTPLVGVFFNLLIYVVLGSQLFRSLGAAGISLTDAIAFTGQAILLFIVLRKYTEIRKRVGERMVNLWGVKRRLLTWIRMMSGKPDVASGRIVVEINILKTLFKAALGGIAGGLLTLACVKLGGDGMRLLAASMAGMVAGFVLSLAFIWREVKMLLRL